MLIACEDVPGLWLVERAWARSLDRVPVGPLAFFREG